MANQYLPGLLQIRPQYTADPDAPNQPENVLWFLSNTHTTPTISNLTAIASAFDNNWGPVFNQYGAANTYYVGSITTDWSSDTGASYTSVGTFTPEEGGGSTSSTAPSVAILISLHIPVRYRGGHGRIYLPHVASGELQAPLYDQISSTLGGRIVTYFNDMVTGMQSSGVLGGQVMGVYRFRNTAGRNTFVPFSSFTVQALLASQRRRLRKAPHR